eukprot:scaffold60996_cov84-Phaeocystis_antarctica.AAC.4
MVVVDDRLRPPLVRRRWRRRCLLRARARAIEWRVVHLNVDAKFAELVDVHHRLVTEFTLLQSCLLPDQQLRSLVTARNPDELPLDSDLAQLIRPLLRSQPRPRGGAEDVHARQVGLNAGSQHHRARHPAPGLGERVVVNVARVHDGQHGQIGTARLACCTGARTHRVAGAHHVPAGRFVLPHLLGNARHGRLSCDELAVEEVAHGCSPENRRTVRAHDVIRCAVRKQVSMITHEHLDGCHCLSRVVVDDRVCRREASMLVHELAHPPCTCDCARDREGSEVVKQNTLPETVGAGGRRRMRLRSQLILVAEVALVELRGRVVRHLDGPVPLGVG